jgi:uncharacterized SAM-binding protein YcdF (DUF218 family)
LLRAIAALVIIKILFGYFAFGQYQSPSDDELRDISISVALGAGESRINAGLALVGEGKVKQIFISGQNMTSFGPNYPAYFAAKNHSVHGVPKIFECCVHWSAMAENTFQNARETQCWLKSEKSRQGIVLITSYQHMARAIAIFSAVIRDRKIVPYPVMDDSVYRDAVHQERLRREEYFKYLAASILLRVPFLGSSRVIYGEYSDGCPSVPAERAR